MTVPIENLASNPTATSIQRQNVDGKSAQFGPILESEKDNIALRQTDQNAQELQLSQKSDNLLSTGETPPVQNQVQRIDSLQPYLDKNTTTAASQVSLPEQIVTDENFLILDLAIPAVNVKRTITGYGNQQSTQLPLRSVSRALDFNISVNSTNTNSDGWFITEDRLFSLDAEKQTIQISGVHYEWDEKKISVGDDDIYIDSKLLSEWFPIDFDVSLNNLTVTLVPREKLPLQVQFERENKRLGLSSPGDMSLRYKLQKSPYELFSLPVMDFSASGGTEGTGTQNSSLNSKYSVVAEGDLAYMGAQVFLSGYEDSWLNKARVRLSRFDNSSTLLGPAKATQFIVGDLFPVDIPGLSRHDVESGMYVSNADLTRSNEFDTTRFEGNLQPGWDVELYRNDKLIKSIRVGSDGRYLFEDIALFFGENQFTILAFGTQGQRRVLAEKSINVGSGMIPKEKFEYALSATQRNKTVLGVDEQHVNGEDNDARLNGNVRYGITNNLSATSGISSVAFDGTRHNYLQAGLGTSLFSVYGQADYIYDTESGNGLSLFGQTRLGPVGLRAKHEIFSGFVDEESPNRELESRTSISLGGETAELSFIPPFSYTLSNKNTIYSDYELGQLYARLSTQIKSVNLSNSTNWAYNGRDGKDAFVTGEFDIMKAIGEKGRVIGGINYMAGEENEISQYRISGYWPIDQNLSAGLGLTHYSTEENERTNSWVTLDWDTGSGNLSPSLSYDTKEGFGAYLTLSFSLGPDPVKENLQLRSDKRTGKGSSAALVYHDLNNNKVFDEGDTPLPEVKVIARQAGKRAESDTSGVAYLYDLQANKPTDVEIDKETLEDPFWHPTVPGVSIVPRAGQVNEITFPVVTTGEIDGTVYFIDKDGFQEPLTGAVIEIIDDKGEVVQSASSEYDGFYLFEKVIPGTYTLRIHPNETLHPQYSNQQQQIIIGNDGTIESGHDILLRNKNAQLENILEKQPSQEHQPLTPGADENQEKQTENDIKTAKPLDSNEQIIQITKDNDKKKNTITSSLPFNTFLSKAKTGQSRASIAIHPLQYGQNTNRPPDLKTQSNQFQTEQPVNTHGVHLASFKTIQSAEEGIDILARELGDTYDRNSFRIRQVDLGPEKGTWYRVIYGSFSSRRDADIQALNMADKTEYAKSIAIETKPANLKHTAPEVLQNVHHMKVAGDVSKPNNTASTLKTLKADLKKVVPPPPPVSVTSSPRQYAQKFTRPTLQNESPPTRPVESRQRHSEDKSKAVITRLPDNQQRITAHDTSESSKNQHFAPFNTPLIIPLPGGPIPELGFRNTTSRREFAPKFSSERELKAKRQLIQKYNQLTTTESSKQSSSISI